MSGVSVSKTVTLLRFVTLRPEAGSFFSSNFAFPPALPFSKYCTVPKRILKVFKAITSQRASPVHKT